MATRLDVTTLRRSREVPQPPPRLLGDAETDLLAIQEWMKQWAQAFRDSGLGDPAYQFAEVPIDKDAPPDPALTTIGRAQATANLALELIKAQAATIAAQAAAIEALTVRVTALETP